MNDDDLTAIHRTLIGFNKRAERSSDAMLVATFVDSAPLFDLLSTPNNQVIYGRRGTGKTHALKYLAQTVERRGEYPIYILICVRWARMAPSIVTEAGPSRNARQP